MNTTQKQEYNSRFSLWLLASIIFHLILIILTLFWYFDLSIAKKIQKKDADQSMIMFAPEPHKKTMQQPQQEPDQQKKTIQNLQKPAIQPPQDYTLIPGRQAVTQATQDHTPNSIHPQQSTQQEPEYTKYDDTASEKKDKAGIIQEKKNTNTTTAALTQTHQPDTKPIPSSPEPIPQVITPQTKSIVASPAGEQETIKPSKNRFKKQKKMTEQKKEALEEKRIQNPIIADPLNPPPTPEERYEAMKQKLLQERKQEEALAQQTMSVQNKITAFKSSEEAKPTTALPYSKNPTIVKTKVTLQDLKLGFSKYMQEGNNDILIHKGASNRPPDAEAMKLITYQQQFARTLRDSLITHPRFQKVAHVRNTSIVFTTSINRTGKLLHVNLITSSNNETFDTILLESVRSVSLYPKVPNHIPGEPLTITWTFLV